MRTPGWIVALGWAVVFLVPVVLVLTAVRLLMTHTYLRIAYRLPGVTEDPFGFTLEDRLRLAERSRQFIMQPLDISYLADLRFDDGRPMFNARELRHMQDVQQVTRTALAVWKIAGGMLVLLTGVLWAAGHPAVLRQALLRGSLLTIGFVALIGILSLVAFTSLFIAFHEIFFPPGTWTFNYSDTLIRLFPEGFWRNAFILVAALSTGMAGMLAGLARLLPNK